MGLSEVEIREGAGQLELRAYAPYPKQREFHEARDCTGEVGSAYFRLFLAGNQVGKTHGAAAEVAMHLTGEYMDGWEGHRFSYPVRVGCAAGSYEDIKRIGQTKLLGDVIGGENWKRGFIPGKLFGVMEKTRNLPGGVKSIAIRHRSGGYSVLKFLSYERPKDFEGEPFNIVWLDEEPDSEIMGRVFARRAVPLATGRGGLIMVTMTPEMGMTEFLREYTRETFKKPQYACVEATWFDTPHFTNRDGELLDKVLASLQGMPERVIQKTIYGKPADDSGLVFDVGRDQYVYGGV